MDTKPAFNFEVLKDLNVLDKDGNQVLFSSLYKDQCAMVCFVRHFGCFVCRDFLIHLDKLTETHQAAIDKAKINVIVIGCGAPVVMEELQKEVKYKGVMYTDPERKIYSALSLKDSFVLSSSNSKYLDTSVVPGLWWSVKKGFRWGLKPGNPSQQGGEFVLGPGDVCHYMYVSQNPTDHADLEDLLKVAGAELVS